MHTHENVGAPYFSLLNNCKTHDQSWNLTKISSSYHSIIIIIHQLISAVKLEINKNTQFVPIHIHIHTNKVYDIKQI